MMKRYLFFIFIISLIAYQPSFSQTPLKTSEIFDVEIGDFFQYKIESSAQTDTFNYRNIEILDKWYNSAGDTLYLKSLTVTFYFFNGEFHSSSLIQTATITSLDKPPTPVDTSFSRPNLYNGRQIDRSYVTNSNTEKTWQDLIKGCGVLNYDSSSQNFYKDSLIYFKKGLEEWGNLKEYLGVENLEFESRINIFPNPASSNLTIRLGQLVATNIELYNLEGKEIYFLDFSESSNIEISIPQSIQNGIYILLVSTDKGILNKRIIIKRE